MKNNNNDWTELMRRRLADSKADVPGDVWNRIESRLDAMPESGGVASKRRLWRLRVAMWVASAAAVAALFVIGYEAGGGDTNVSVVADGRVSTSKRGGKSAVATESLGGPYVASLNGESTMSGEKQAGNNYCGSSILTDYQCEKTAARLPEKTAARLPEKTAGEHLAQQSGESHEETASGVGGQEDVADDKHVDEPLVAMGNTLVDYGLHSASTKSAGTRWSVSAHTDGAFVDVNNESHPLLAAAYKMCSDNGDESYSFTSSNKILQASRYKEIRHHAQPVSFGLSVGYALSERLSLTTGMVYTRAESELSNVSGDDEIVSTQRLHYIGVPLSLRFTVWANRYVQTYAIGGAQADFNVSATTTTSGVRKSSGRDRVQFSAGAAAGVQLNVVPGMTPQVGIYAEPGVKYYFDNNSAVETIFKEKPCRFNLQVGIRLGF